MIDSGALFSPDEIYRYKLWREWSIHDAEKFVLFILLNPSTADAENDDPTIRRCIGYAKTWGYDGLMIGNIFAYRATLPKDMLSHESPIGEDNNKALLEMAEKASLIVCGWGNHGLHMSRSEEVKNLLKDYKLHYLSLTKSGEPGHPLYLKKDLLPIDFFYITV